MGFGGNSIPLGVSIDLHLGRGKLWPNYHYQYYCNKRYAAQDVNRCSHLMRSRRNPTGAYSRDKHQERSSPTKAICHHLDVISKDLSSKVAYNSKVHPWFLNAFNRKFCMQPLGHNNFNWAPFEPRTPNRLTTIHVNYSRVHSAGMTDNHLVGDSTNVVRCFTIPVGSSLNSLKYSHAAKIHRPPAHYLTRV